jgi:hypothetical protein
MSSAECYLPQEENIEKDLNSLANETTRTEM